MHTTAVLNPIALPQPITLPHWDAELKLGFIRRDGRSYLAQRHHRGPLVVQKTLYPEGESVCHAIILHPPGGVAGGDRLKIGVTAGAEAHALLTTPGAGKWYKANGREASQHLDFRVDDNAVLEWLPQETIVYDAAQVVWDTTVTLAESARYAGWEITCLGRQASREQFRCGSLRQSLRIYRASRLIWGEHGKLGGGDEMLASPVGLHGCSVYATFVVAAGSTPPQLLESCRAVPAPESGLGPDQVQGRVGVTALPEVFVARYLGNSSQAARHYFEAIWAVWRPHYAGVAAQRPRIWNT
jgi:urease accessory protein